MLKNKSQSPAKETKVRSKWVVYYLTMGYRKVLIPVFEVSSTS